MEDAVDDEEEDDVEGGVLGGEERVLDHLGKVDEEPDGEEHQQGELSRDQEQSDGVHTRLISYLKRLN